MSARTWVCTVIMLWTPAVCWSQAPSISPDGVVPVFSRANIDNTIQPGSWISIYGRNLASGTATWTGNFPTSLGGTSVSVNGKPAYLWFVSPGQINAQTPDDTTRGAVSVGVTTAAGSAFASVNLAPFAPAFSLLDGKHVTGIILRPNGSGSQGGGSYDILGPTGNSLGYATVAAAPGDDIVIFGVGFGPTTPPVPAGKAFSGAAPLTNGINVLINGVAMKPVFVGLSSAGLYQVNLTVPSGLGTGDLPLLASNGSQTQPGVVISLRSLPVGPQLQSLTLSSGSVVSGTSVTGTVTLSAAAPAGGTTVLLSSTSTTATVPSSVLVPVGAASATFSISTAAVATSQTVAIVATLAGVSRQASLSVTPQQVISSSTQTISVGQSSTFTLADGSSVSIPAGFGQTSQIATVSLLGALPQQPPSGLISGVGRVLRLSITPAVSSGSQSATVKSPDVQFNLNLSQSTAASLTGAMGMVQFSVPQLTSADLQPTTLGVPAVIDIPNKRATLTLPGSMIDYFRLANSSSSVSALGERAFRPHADTAPVTATVAVGNRNPGLAPAPPDLFGPRQWNPVTNRWSSYPLPGFDRTKKTCVLVHGVASTVEGAFRDGSDPQPGVGCDAGNREGAVSKIAAANGCQQVLGFNYFWWQRVNKSGEDLASFLIGTGLREITVEAHSLGGVVSMAALGRIPASQIKVTNLVTLGSPHLGTSAAAPESVFSVFAMVPYIGTTVGAGYAIADALDTTALGFAADVSPGSETLAENLSKFVNNHPDAHVIAVGGGGTVFGPILHGQIFGTKETDGLVDTASAMCVGCPIPKLSAAAFPANHVSLACNESVIKFVGEKIASPASGALTLTVVAAGPGTVTADKFGPTYTPGTVVTLTAKANTGATFTGWSGGCTGTGTCVVTMTSNVTVTATFKAPFTLTVIIAGITGSGTVTASPAGLSYVAGTPVTLTATADSRSTFTGWGGASGACTGTTPTCTLTIKGDDIITANFAAKQFTLTVTTNTGSGSGVVAFNTPGPAYLIGTVVTLTATAAPGSTFAGWSGACTGTGTCIVTMNSNLAVTATFTLTTAPSGSLSGIWTGTWTYPFGNFCAFMNNALTWNLTQNGSTITGTYAYVVTSVDPDGLCPRAVGDRVSGNLGNGRLTGSTLTFDTFGNRGFTGTITGTRIVGTGGTTALTTGPFTLTKQ